MYIEPSSLYYPVLLEQAAWHMGCRVKLSSSLPDFEPYPPEVALHYLQRHMNLPRWLMQVSDIMRRCLRHKALRFFKPYVEVIPPFVLVGL
jgi:hypothetical protein